MVQWTCALLALLFQLAGNKHAAEIASRLESRYRSARTLQATFLERYTESGRLLRSEAGTAYFRRPGKMRWEYERPEKNLFLVDGKTAWFYVPADHTVTRVPAKQSGDLRTPLALLAGQMKISRVCSHIDFSDAEEPLVDGNAVLRCMLRGEKQDTARAGEPENALGAGANDAVFFEVVRDSGELARLMVRQGGGVEVEFRFENWRIDPPLPDSMFRFQPAAGVAIVNGELAEENAPVK
jgi:outer membrane lipoprotein carrier protein